MRRNLDFLSYNFCEKIVKHEDKRVAYEPKTNGCELVINGLYSPQYRNTRQFFLFVHKFLQEKQIEFAKAEHKTAILRLLKVQKKEALEARQARFFIIRLIIAIAESCHIITPLTEAYKQAKNDIKKCQTAEKTSKVALPKISDLSISYEAEGLPSVEEIIGKRYPHFKAVKRNDFHETQVPYIWFVRLDSRYSDYVQASKELKEKTGDRLIVVVCHAQLIGDNRHWPFAYSKLIYTPTEITTTGKLGVNVVDQKEFIKNLEQAIQEVSQK
jgi:hypothetical protein